MTRYAYFASLTFPMPDCISGQEDSVNYKLRYSPESLTKPDLLYAASIVEAYNQLIYRDSLKSSAKKISSIKIAIKRFMKETKQPKDSKEGG